MQMFEPAAEQAQIWAILLSIANGLPMLPWLHRLVGCRQQIAHKYCLKLLMVEDPKYQ
jgi:hypothetical protein